MATALYNCEIGKEIKITDSGGTAVFFVVEHEFAGSIYRTAVVRKDSISTSRMPSDIYLNCTDIQNFLNTTYYNSIDEVVRKRIYRDNLIACADSAGNIKYIEGYVFPPSAHQLDLPTSSASLICYPEGSPFTFFRRYTVNEYAPWTSIMTRSRAKPYNNKQGMIMRNQLRFGTTSYRNVTYTNPMFWIKKGLYINSDGTLFAPKPSVPSGVKYTGEPFFESKGIEISWNASSIEDNTPIKYEVSVKENSGSWNILRTTSSLSCVATLPASDGSKTVTYRVRAQSSNGDEYSDYATGPVITVLHNSAPSVPNGITFSTPKAGTPITVSTEGSTDIDNDPIVYEFERQIDSSEWTSVEMTFNKSTTDTVPSSGEYINYRVRARDNYGNRSAYTTGVKQLISYLPGVTNPGKPMYKYPISGLDMDITWGAAASEDASIVTYAVEVKIDDGEWIDRGQTSQTEFKFYIPRLDEEGHTIQVRIKAKIPNGSESEYSTGKVTEILYHKVRRLIPWNFGTDFRIRQFTKNSRSQYQTMLSGSTAEIIATGNLRLGDMPLETVVRFGKIYNEPIAWKIADKNHEGYPNNSVSFVNVYGLRGICFDAKEPNNPVKYAVEFGNADYRISNAHSWLNSDKPAGQWYTPRHEYDAPPDKNNVFFTQGMPVNPYDDFPGFLYEFTEKEKNSIMETNFLVVVPKEKDTTEVASIRSKIALISRYELNGGDGLSLKDGTPFPIFKDNLSRQIYLTQTCVVKSNYMYNHSTEKPNDYWMRGCMADESTTGRWFGFKCNNDGSLVTSAHPSNLSCHVTAMPFRCVLNISADTMLNPNPNPDGSYNIVWE